MWTTLAELTGAALIVAGIAFVFWPLALVAAGAFALLGVAKSERAA